MKETTVILVYLFSPRHNESYFSCSKYYPSEHRLTELFDAKKKRMYPDLRKENLPVEYSSKSSKSSSDISVKYGHAFRIIVANILSNDNIINSIFRLNSMFKNAIDRKHRETLRNENFQAHHRNAISVPLFPRKRYAKCGKRSRRSSMNAETVKMSPACKKFTKTIDDCKKYLKELHDSNKNLGLVCSSSEMSNESSIKNFWSDTQVKMNKLLYLETKLSGVVNDCV
ncbi:uncharacterized protein LOC117233625 [Bombus vosnesenskii]|uniref:Uncharacterized protein LOC117233625 n=1 Tax=Bombus vosnesenskii TaxID=207650 RepID=A0A6J3KC11_9HYME|nr:uncharacterized protein LOC117233625 [Bombus vosnesenskii]